MATVIYFVTENYLKVNTPITANVNITEVLPLVKGAADMWTQSTLGTYFYNDLLVKYNAQTLNPDEETLVALMQPSIAWRAAADAVIVVCRFDECQRHICFEGQQEVDELPLSPLHSLVLYQDLTRGEEMLFSNLLLNVPTS